MKHIIFITLVFSLTLFIDSKNNNCYADIGSRDTIYLYKGDNTYDIVTTSAHIPISWVDATWDIIQSAKSLYDLYTGIAGCIANYGICNWYAVYKSAEESYENIDRTINDLSDHSQVTRTSVDVDVYKYTKMIIKYHAYGDPLGWVRCLSPFERGTKFFRVDSDFEGGDDHGRQNITMTASLDLTDEFVKRFNGKALLTFSANESDCWTCGKLVEIIDLNIHSSAIDRMTIPEREAYQKTINMYDEQKTQISRAEDNRKQILIQTGVSNRQQRFDEEYNACLRRSNIENITCPDPPAGLEGMERTAWCQNYKKNKSDSLKLLIEPCRQNVISRYQGNYDWYMRCINDENTFNKIHDADLNIIYEKINFKKLSKAIDNHLRGIEAYPNTLVKLTLEYGYKEANNNFSKKGEDIIITSFNDDSVSINDQIKSIIENKEIELNLDMRGEFKYNEQKCNFIKINFNVISEKEPSRRLLESFAFWSCNNIPINYSGKNIKFSNMIREIDRNNNVYYKEGTTQVAKLEFFPGQLSDSITFLALVITEKDTAYGDKSNKLLYSERINWTTIYNLKIIKKESSSIVNPSTYRADEKPGPPIIMNVTNEGYIGDTIFISGGNFFPRLSAPGEGFIDVNIGNTRVARFRPTNSSHGLPRDRLSSSSLIKVVIKTETPNGILSIVTRWGNENIQDSVSSNINFINLGSPSLAKITKIHPQTGLPGTLVTIEGENFTNKKVSYGNSRNLIWFNGHSVPFISWTNNKIIFKIPKGAFSDFITLICSSMNMRKVITMNKFEIKLPKNDIKKDN